MKRRLPHSPIWPQQEPRPILPTQAEAEMTGIINLKNEDTNISNNFKSGQIKGKTHRHFFIRLQSWCTRGRHHGSGGHWHGLAVWAKTIAALVIFLVALLLLLLGLSRTQQYQDNRRRPQHYERIRMLLPETPCNVDYLDTQAVLEHVRVATDHHRDGGIPHPSPSTPSSSSSSSSSQRILCFLMTHQGSHETRVRAVLETWGQKCDQLVVASNVTDLSIGGGGGGGGGGGTVVDVAAIRAPSTYEGLWLKLNETLHYVYDTYRNDYDWFLKVDDDSFVILENLRFFLASSSRTASTKDVPMAFGHVQHYEPYNYLLHWPGSESPENQAFLDYYFSKVIPNGRIQTAKYLAGGGGYVMNRLYLNEFIQGLQDPKRHPHGSPPEDLAHGMTMTARGILPSSALDKMGRNRFMQETPALQKFTHDVLINKGELPEMLRNKPTAAYPITFHHITPRHMRYMYDQLYTCRSGG